MTLDVVALLHENFPKATAEVYFHYVMKNCLNKASFTGTKIAAMVSRCALSKGEESPLERKAAFDWTPLHVAAIRGNRSGLHFLISQGVLKGHPDVWGKTPYDYCRELHPEYAPLLAEPFPPAENDDLQILQSNVMKLLMASWKVALPVDNFCYQQHTNDFGLEIDELLFLASNDHLQSEDGCSTPLKVDHFVSNMQEIAAEEGFKLLLTSEQYCPRDHLIIQSAGEISLPSMSDNVAKAIEKNNSFCAIEQNKAAFLTDQKPFLGCLGTADGRASHPLEDMVKIIGYTPGTIPALKFYCEGGNQFVATNKLGERKLLIGIDTIRVAHLQMRLDRAFSDPLIDLQGKTNKIKETLSFPEIRQAVEEMYFEGLLTSSKHTLKGMISNEEIAVLYSEGLQEYYRYGTSHFPSHLYADVAQKFGFYMPLSLSDQQVANMAPVAAKFLAERAIMLEIMARTFGVASGDICVLPQAGYHLDTFMKPGPLGSFFVQNYQMTVELLQGIEANGTKLNLSKEDLKLVDTYRTIASRLGCQLGNLIDIAMEKLTAAGFSPVPAPGLFFDDNSVCLSPEGAIPKNINFLNAISGWSPKQNRYYYIATGAMAGTKVGGLLMEAFRSFLYAYEPNLALHFIGHDPNDKSDFSEGMAWWGIHDAQAGPHCFSCEIKTSSHHF